MDEVKRINLQYNKWLQTPIGKQRKKDVDERKCLIIHDLPSPWVIEEKGIDESYVIYYNLVNGKRLIVDMDWSAPIHQGGKQFYVLSMTIEGEEEEEIVVTKLIAEHNWSVAASIINCVALYLMHFYK